MPTPIGMRTVKNWTAKRAHRFAMQRVEHIQLLLQEIAIAYAEVDSYIESRCDEIRDLQLQELRTSLVEALAEGRTP